MSYINRAPKRELADILARNLTEYEFSNPEYKRMNLEEGNLLIISDSDDSICMKKIELPKVKSWKEATKPFREAAKKSNFTDYDLKKLIEESRIR